MRFPVFGLGNSSRHNRALWLRSTVRYTLFTNCRRVPRGKICIDLYKKVPERHRSPPPGGWVEGTKGAREKEKDRAEPSLLWAGDTAGNHRTFFMPRLQLARGLKKPTAFCKSGISFASRCQRCACESVRWLWCPCFCLGG